MSRFPTSRPGWLRRSVTWCSAWLLTHGQRPYAIWSMSAASTLDGVLPMMPAEFMALALMIMQPRRVIQIAFVFTMSAAVSAGLLAALVSGIAQATSWPGWLEIERQGAAWTQAVSLIRAWGASALAMAAVFPDSPRTAVAVAALAGFAPISITGLVLAGKLMLYGLLAAAVRYIPMRWPSRAAVSWPGVQPLRRAFLRFAALRRWVKQRAAQEGRSSSAHKGEGAASKV